MSLDIESPQPQPSLKRTFADDEAAGSLCPPHRPHKRRRLKCTRHPSKSILADKNSSSLRKPQDQPRFRSASESSPRRQRQTTADSNYIADDQEATAKSSVAIWIDSLAAPNNADELVGISTVRASSCPPVIDVGVVKRCALVAGTLDDMSERRSSTVVSSAQSSRSGIKDPKYRDRLQFNGITMDISGRKIDDEVRTFLDRNILKQRDSPPLGDEAVNEIIDCVERDAAETEDVITQLTNTKMFPMSNHQSLRRGGNSQWNRLGLPRNEEFAHALVAPKPDITLGYDRTSPWTARQANVIQHPFATGYIQPGPTGPILPFLTMEVKAEATGGTLFEAENQAAGSGSQAVGVLKWLLEQASQPSTQLDTIAFSIAMSHREAILYVHWYSEEQRRYFMSHLRNFSTISPSDIRACNGTVKNIIDYALGDRMTKVVDVLGALFPFPAHWTMKRAAPADTMTPPSSASGSTGRVKRSKTSVAEEPVE